MPENVNTFLGERMGNAYTSIKCGFNKTPWRKQKNSEWKGKLSKQKTAEGNMSDDIDDDIERQEIFALRKLIREKPNIFILNNLIMSIQLFSHYEREIEAAHQKMKMREDEMNQKILPDKMVLMPDVLREHFADRIRFTSYCKSESDVQTVELLRPIKIYLVFENVLITELEKSRYYSNLNEHAVDHTFILKETSRKGYVRLKKNRKLSLARDANSDSTDLSLVEENQDEILNAKVSACGSFKNRRQMSNIVERSTPLFDLQNEEIYCDERSISSLNDNCQIMGTSNIRASSRSTIDQSSSSSSSGYITTHYGLDSDSDSSGSRSTIPDRCFKSITYMYNGRIYDPRKQQRPLTSQQKRIRDAKFAHNYDVVYLSSYRFARHFYDILRDTLAEKMGFDEIASKSAKRNEATVRFEKLTPDYLFTKNYISVDHYEVIPCLTSPWPKWAKDWLERTRGNWPTYEDLRRLEKLPCHLVPESPQRLDPNTEQCHPLWKLDWSLSFPDAERYLESRLSVTQMTVYSMVLMLHKTFVRTTDTIFGLDIEHIRNMLFWMVERQPVWSDLEMGKSMIILLESLHNRIQQRTMFDYFVHDRNLFANVQIDDLLHSQKQLKRIIENPVMFVLHAMEKIHYERNDYPRLNYKELLRLMTISELLLINPFLENIQNIHRQPEGTTGRSYGRREIQKNFWTEAKETTQHYLQRRKRNTNTFVNPKKMLDNIIDIQEKCEPLTNIRLSYLLIFFSEHFLKMARSCNKYGLTHQKHLYLNQTRRFARLLSEDLDHKQTSEWILSEVRKVCYNIKSIEEDEYIPNR